MDDPNITMEEYIRLEEEKARRYGRTFNWQTAIFGKVKNYKDEDDHPIHFETEFLAIVFYNTLTAIQSKTTVYLENEFPAIVYNNGLTSKLDFGIKPLINSECIDEINLIDETSLFEYDEEIVSRFNDLFNDIHPDDLKSEKDDDDNDIGIIQSSEDNEITHGENGFSETSYDKIIKTFETIEEYTKGIRHCYEQRLKTIWSRPVNQVHVLDFKGLTTEIRQDLAVRLRMVYSGEGQQVFVSHAWRWLFGIRGPLVREFILEFLSTCRISDIVMDLDTADTLCFQLGGVRRRMTWRQFILALGLHTELEMAEAGFGAYWAGSDRLIPDKEDLRDYWIEISSDRDFLGLASYYAPEKVTGIDLFYLRSMDHGTINVPHLLAQYLFRHAEGRKRGAKLSGGNFIGRLAMHFGLVSDDGLRGLHVVTRELPLIDLHEIGRLHICTRYGEIWNWVAHGPERQQAAAAGTDEADEAGQAAEKAAPEIPAPAPAQAPPPPPPSQQPRTMSQRIERLEEEVHDLRRDVVGLRGDVASFTTEQSRVSTWLISCMTQLMDTNG
ncbi:hypothetical protein Tco_0382459 [Tanacetum coccineum]